MPGVPLVGNLALTPKSSIVLIYTALPNADESAPSQKKTRTTTIPQGLTKMLDFDYVNALLSAGKDVPYRTCTICKTPMFSTTRNYQPHLISCRCRPSGETALCRISWDDLKTLLSGVKVEQSSHLEKFHKGGHLD